MRWHIWVFGRISRAHTESLHDLVSLKSTWPNEPVLVNGSGRVAISLCRHCKWSSTLHTHYARVFLTNTTVGNARHDILCIMDNICLRGRESPDKYKDVTWYILEQRIERTNVHLLSLLQTKYATLQALDKYWMINLRRRYLYHRWYMSLVTGWIQLSHSLLSQSYRSISKLKIEINTQRQLTRESIHFWSSGYAVQVENSCLISQTDSQVFYQRYIQTILFYESLRLWTYCKMHRTRTVDLDMLVAQHSILGMSYLLLWYRMIHTNQFDDSLFIIYIYYIV